MDKLRVFTENRGYNKKILLANDNSFIIYEKTKLPLEYIDTIYIEKPNIYSSIADIKLACRDNIKTVKYRTEGRDFNIVFYHDGKTYKFHHISFSNMDYILEIPI